MVDLKGIGERVFMLRKGAKLGLKELGASSGLSTGMLCRIESAKRIPSLSALDRIAEALGVGTSYLLEGVTHVVPSSKHGSVRYISQPGIRNRPRRTPGA